MAFGLSLFFVIGWFYGAAWLCSLGGVDGGVGLLVAAYCWVVVGVGVYMMVCVLAVCRFSAATVKAR